MFKVKQCHLPSPSHHHFYRWYKPVPVMAGLWHGLFKCVCLQICFSEVQRTWDVHQIHQITAYQRWRCEKCGSPAFWTPKNYGLLPQTCGARWFFNGSSGADDLNDSESSNSNHTMDNWPFWVKLGVTSNTSSIHGEKNNQMLLANPMVIQSLESRGLDSMEVSSNWATPIAGWF